MRKDGIVSELISCYRLSHTQLIDLKMILISGSAKYRFRFHFRYQRFAGMANNGLEDKDVTDSQKLTSDRYTYLITATAGT